jgi:hypothetical protein
MNQSYEDHVKEALDEVKIGQHLRFINNLYRTKEVCLEAVKFESTHNLVLHDFHEVPMGNLDYVMEHMREIQKNNPEYLENLEAAYIEKKKREQEPGYYGIFKSYQEVLNHHGVTNYDDMTRKIYKNL